MGLIPVKRDSYDSRLLKKDILLQRQERKLKRDDLRLLKKNILFSKDKKESLSEEQAEYITPAKTVT
jgi:hypothetical protein